MLRLSVFRPSLNYSSEVLEGNKFKAASLDSMLGGAKGVFGCSSKILMKPSGEIWS